jgi:hypothetical protein
VVRARYFDPRGDRVVETDVMDEDGVRDLIEIVITLDSKRGHPALEIEDANGSSLTIGISGNRAVLMWADSLDESRHTVSGASGDTIWFDYFGSSTEVPSEYCIHLEQAREAVLSFVRGGLPEADEIMFEPD